MAGNEGFELTAERGWRRGLANLLGNGLDSWFKTRAWWTHCLIWGGITIVIVGAIAFNPQAPPVDDLLMVAFVICGLFPAVGVIIVMQDAIVGEKREGTAAWILSKPVARQAFVLSKFISNSVGVLLTMAILPAVLIYLVILISQKTALPGLGFSEATGVIFVNLLYFLSLTLMLGTLFSNRAPVIGIPLAILFLQQNILGLAPALRFVLPWILVAPLGNTNPLVFRLVRGSAVPTEQLITLAIILVEIVLFTIISVWRFTREEF